MQLLSAGCPASGRRCWSMPTPFFPGLQGLQHHQNMQVQFIKTMDGRRIAFGLIDGVLYITGTVDIGGVFTEEARCGGKRPFGSSIPCIDCLHCILVTKQFKVQSCVIQQILPLIWHWNCWWHHNLVYALMQYMMLEQMHYILQFHTLSFTNEVFLSLMQIWHNDLTHSLHCSGIDLNYLTHCISWSTAARLIDSECTKSVNANACL